VPELRLGSVVAGDGRPTVVIAEAACEHLGSLETAFRMVEAANEAGADVIKFQLHLPEEMIPGSIEFWGGSMDEVLERWNIDVEGQAGLQERCREVGIQYLCTPFSAAAARQLDGIGVEAFKTGSGEMTNLPMLRAIARLGKPMLVSTGMASLEEVDETVAALREEGADFGLTNCTSAYPPRYEDVRLGLIAALRERYGVVVGHSDHTPDGATAIAAVALGAPVVEKHFTLDRERGGPDRHVSLEPAELRQLVDSIRKVEVALGGEKDVLPDEAVVRRWAHHSVAAVRPIAAGTAITPDLVTVKRPGWGIPAKHLDEVVGAVAARDIPADRPLQWEDLR
jgi:N-acetylneuraminate synthase